MKKYRKLPVVIEAVQWDGTMAGAAAIEEWSKGAVESFGRDRAPNPNPINLAVTTMGGEIMARPGDWIIKGIEGEFYPCTNAIFMKTYEEAT